MMKKLLASAALGVALVVSGCGGGESNETPSPTSEVFTPTPSTSTLTDNVTPEDRYLVHVKYDTGLSDEYTDVQLLTLGHTTCSLLGQYPTKDVLIAIANSGIDTELAASIVVNATHDLCPKYYDRVMKAVE